MSKKLLFSVTAKDCEFSYTKGSGKGGQKRNKTASAVHCKHPPSGAYGYSDKTRSQHDNKRDAFLKMTRSKKFQTWLKLETSRRTGDLIDIEKYVDHEIKNNVKTEIRENGKWTIDNGTTG